jgi:RNA polymerase primary sigma factor
MTDAKRKRRRAAPQGIAPSEPERDILDQYLYEVSTYPLLKGDEEIVLARKIRAGDPDALQELVKRNLRFVISVAKKYQNRGLPLIDLIGEGNVGLLTAARKFDPDQGVKFISYAVWWIRQAILSSLARQGRTVRVPLNRTADLSRIIKASEILRQKLRREPSPRSCRSSPGCRWTWCSRWLPSTRVTCASTRRWTPRATARSSSGSSPTRCRTPRRRR